MKIETRAICLNCRHWKGDRGESLRQIEKDRKRGTLVAALCPRGGWMPSGECVDLAVELCAFQVETPAGFSCAFFEWQVGPFRVAANKETEMSDPASVRDAAEELLSALDDEELLSSAWTGIPFDELLPEIQTSLLRVCQRAGLVAERGREE